MPFSYVATTAKGKVRRGTLDLGSRNSALEWLDRQGLVPISVDEVRPPRSVERLNALILGTVSHVEKLIFTKHLSVMLQAGLSLLESLDILAEQASTWRFRTIVSRLAARVRRGDKLSDALAVYPRVFNAFFVNIIRAGEASGNLEKNLNHLAVQMQKEHELRARVRTAMLYPTIVLIAAAFIGFFFATYVLPQVANLFVGLRGIELPLVTIWLLRVSNFLRHYTFASFIGLVAGIFGLIWLLRWPRIAFLTHRAVLRLPIIGKIVKDVNLARFSLVFGTLLRSGLDIIKAAEITSTVLGNVYYRKVLERTLIALQRGAPVSEVLANENRLFPKLTSRMIAVGERTGKLDEVLGYLSDYYELEVETATKNLSTVLEPLLLLFIGGVAMAMAYAILIPIYNFIAAIRRI